MKVCIRFTDWVQASPYICRFDGLFVHFDSPDMPLNTDELFNLFIEETYGK